ncbi:MAG: tRNA pseudouridine(55) synthase TruB [Firmicutes bacterium]|nr:tRNA pseudouridine(55) synthase TruB [Bacillota bacterium]MBR0441444.1 tRNA pseudouridine(55) synthase TruB [Bacillota bacterium]
MDGFLRINKPAGMSSSDVVMNVRRLTKEKKAGHTGTLDPNACGLLVVALGRASRLIEYMDSAAKVYRCRAVLGLATDTHDVWGTAVRDIRGCFEMPSEDDVADALTALEGQISQVPSRYSAIRQDGKRLYELAREGREVRAKERQIGVFMTSLIDFDPASGEFFFDVRCSSGTYVRTLCDMAGEILGCGASMSALLRLETCGFALEDSVTLEELAEMSPEDVRSVLAPCEAAVSELPRCELADDERASRFLTGLGFNEDQCIFPGEGAIPGLAVSVWKDGRFLGTAMPLMESGRLYFSPGKVFS